MAADGGKGGPPVGPRARQLDLAEGHASLSLTFGMPHDFGNMNIVSLAARFRVAHREAAAAGGLHLRRRVRELNEALPCRGGGPAGRIGSDTPSSAGSRRRPIAATSSAFDVQLIEKDLLSEGAHPLTRAQTKRLHSGVQRAARTCLDDVLRTDSEGRLRHRLER